MGNEINSAEIARLAGVSRSTVSRVVNNYSNVPETTRQRVLEVIERYNYYPNLSAQVLAGKRTRTLGLFMVDVGSVSSDSISNMLLSRIIESASAKGYFVLAQIVSSLGEEKQARAVKECFYQQRIDGGIFIGMKNDEPLIEELVMKGFVVGIADQKPSETPETNRIVYNFADEAGVQLAIDHLASLNHRRIGIINGDEGRFSGYARRAAFRRETERRKIEVRPEWIMSGSFSEGGGYAAMNRLLRSGRELPTALFAANDSIAFGAIRALREAGLDVPRHMSIVGFDDHLLSARHHPPLTTIRVDFGSMLDGLTGAVIEAIEQGSGAQGGAALAKPALVERSSCKGLDMDE